MKFATRPDLGLNRPPAIWFIRRFLDPEAGILFLAKETIFEEAPRLGAVVFHVPGAELHMDKERGRTTLDALVDRYGWRGKDAALELFTDLIRDASYGVPAGAAKFPESHAIRALNLGFRTTTPDDRARVDKLCDVYDAWYAWCRGRVAETAAPV